MEFKLIPQMQIERHKELCQELTRKGFTVNKEFINAKHGEVIKKVPYKLLFNYYFILDRFDRKYQVKLTKRKVSASQITLQRDTESTADHVKAVLMLEGGAFKKLLNGKQLKDLRSGNEIQVFEEKYEEMVSFIESKKKDYEE